MQDSHNEQNTNTPCEVSNSVMMSSIC